MSEIPVFVDGVTPISAPTFNDFRDYLHGVRDETRGYRDQAEAAAEAASAPVDDQIAELVSDAGSATRAQLDARYRNQRLFNVADYGALGNGSVDDTAAIQSALTAAGAAGGGVVYLPRGIYQISTGLTFGDVAGVRLIGAGRGVSWLRGTDTTSTIITMGHAPYCAVGDLSITRVTRATTGHGIRITGAGEAGYLDLFNLHILDQTRGIFAGPCTFGFIRNVVVEGCTGDGIFFTNTTTSGAIQWELSGVLSQRNGGSGFRVFAQGGGVGQITMGTWRGIYTFGNSGSGLRFEGVASCPIYDIRVSEFFIGEDGDSEIYLDTYGGMHVIGSGMIELCGKRTTGPTTTTPATNAGHGILVGANNVDVTIAGPTMIWSCSYSGIYVGGGNVLVSGGVFLKDNGQTATAGVAFHCGLYVQGGDVQMTGCQARGSQYGAYTAVDNVMWVANRLKGSVAATGNAVALTNSLVANNRTN